MDGTGYCRLQEEKKKGFCGKNKEGGEAIVKDKKGKMSGSFLMGRDTEGIMCKGQLCFVILIVKRKKGKGVW